MKVLDLFAGIGGFAIASKWAGFTTGQFVEIDPFCQKVLTRNFPGVPIHDDVSTFTAARGTFDIITGGFPCQDASVSNANGSGLDGSRTGLFFEIMRIACDVRPRYIVMENVPGLLSRGFGRVLSELDRIGFNAEWQCIRASELGAPHARKRLFIVAYSKGIEPIGSQQNQTGTKQTFIGGDSWWRSHPHPEPSIPRVGHGLPSGMDRSRALGNAVTPQQALIPLLRIKQLEAQQ